MRAAEQTQETAHDAAAALLHQADFSGLAGEPCVAVAVSGGSDSMALLLLTISWAAQQLIPPRVVALTVDHGLRAASAAEALQVQHWADEAGVEHATLHWHGAKPATGIQAKARQARYDLLSAWCRENGFRSLLSAHTRNDQAETVAMRQLRTSTVQSLSAIWPETSWNGIRVMRPLLAAPRDALRQFLRASGQDWIEDPSNDDPRFERVRVRAALGPEEVEQLPLLAEQSRAAVLNLERRARVWLESEVTVHELAYFSFPRSSFAALEEEVRAHALGRLVQIVGRARNIAPVPLNDLAAWALAHESGRRTLGGGLVALRRRAILVAREAGRIMPAWQSVPESGELEWDGRFRITAPPGTRIGAMGPNMPQARHHRVPDYVHAALPLAKMADGRLISACDDRNSGISAVMSRRFVI